MSATAYAAPAGWWLAAVLAIDGEIDAQRLDPAARGRIREDLAHLQDLVFELDAALATAQIDLPKPLTHLANYSAIARTHEVVQAARGAVRAARKDVQ